MKNMLTVAGVIAFLLLSQNPAEAGPVKRSFLRVVKWGICFPVRCIALVHSAPALLIYGAAGAGELACDSAIQDDEDYILKQTGWIPEKEPAKGEAK